MHTLKTLLLVLAISAGCLATSANASASASAKNEDESSRYCGGEEDCGVTPQPKWCEDGDVDCGLPPEPPLCVSDVEGACGPSPVCFDDVPICIENGGNGGHHKCRSNEEDDEPCE